MFLCAESINNIYFTNDSDVTKTSFVYQIDGNKIKLYKTIKCGYGENIYEKNYCLGIKRDVNN